MRNSFLRKLNPITKGLFTMFLIIVISLFCKSFVITFNVICFILLGCIFSREDVIELFVSLKKIWLLIFFIGIFQSYVGNKFDYINAINSILKLIGVYFTALLYTKFSNQSELLYFWELMFKPLRIIGVSSSDIALMMVIAIRFLPVFMSEIDRIKMAQIARGAKLRSGGFASVMSFMPLLIPVLHQSLRRSEELADAMEVRGYVPDMRRGKYKVYSYNKNDLFILLIAILLILFLIYF